MMAVHFWIDSNKVYVAQQYIFADLLRSTIPETEMCELCDSEGFRFNARDRGPWQHNGEEIRQAYNIYSPWSGFTSSSYYFEGRQFTPQQIMAETPTWIAFLDDLNAIAHHRIADRPDAIPFTTTNIFRSMLAEDGDIDPVIRLAKALRVEYLGITYTLDAESLQPTSHFDSDVTGPLRATADALLREFERKEKLLTKALNKERAPTVKVTPRMVRKGFVTFTDGETQVLARRVVTHRTRYFAVRGVRYPILPDWQAQNSFFLCCAIRAKDRRPPGTFWLVTDDLRRPFHNAHTGGSGIPCLGTASLVADKSDQSPWETIFDNALAALEVINFSSLNEWGVMDRDRLERRLIEAARAAPGWPTQTAQELATMIQRGRLPFCDPSASPMEGWG